MAHLWSVRGYAIGPNELVLWSLLPCTSRRQQCRASMDFSVFLLLSNMERSKGSQQELVYMKMRSNSLAG